jgi:exopolysaccharide biosynthesis predicted pyruvyltransferase EpsI
MTGREDDAALLQALRARTLAVLGALVGRGEEVGLLDVPTYENVGDSMIWAGQNAYLKAIGARVTYIADLNWLRPDLLRERVGAGAVLLQGGGNFGDLWPEHQAYRERVVSELGDRRIVQLPQSVHFRDRANAKRANAILGRHPDFTLMVRDTASLERARRDLPDIRTVFCPDMALGWTPVPPRHQHAQSRTVALLRRDREAVEGLYEAVTERLSDRGARTVDWGHHGLDRVSWAAVRTPLRRRTALAALRTSAAGYPLLEAAYRGGCRLNLRSGVRLLAGASLVVTDRLHAHVLAALLGIPHVVFDNSYGKIRSMVEGYTGAFSTAVLCTEVRDLDRCVAQALKGA